MTTATLTTSTLAQTQSTTSVGLALKELGISAQRLGKAIWISMVDGLVSQPTTPTPRQAALQTALEQRLIASAIAASNPQRASRLFAAADCQEFGDRS